MVLAVGESIQRLVGGLGGGAVGGDSAFDCDRAVLIQADRLVDIVRWRFRPAVNDGSVFLADSAVFEESAKMTGGFVGFGEDTDPAGFAIQAMDHVQRVFFPEVHARAADEAGPGVALGRVADQAGGLVDHKQLLVLVDDVQARVHLAIAGGGRGKIDGGNQSFNHVARSVSFAAMPTGWQKFLPYLFLAMFAVMRLPGLDTQGFSLAYALVFCAGAFPRLLHIGWVAAVIFASDMWLNVYYDALFTNSQLINYLAYTAIYFLGRAARKQTSLGRMIVGGLLGALIFYVVTNTAAWMVNPQYAKTLAGWWQALTVGLPGWPQSWTFFRNTMISGGLFSGVIAAVMNSLQATEPEPEEAEEPEEAPEATEGEEQAKA